MTRENFEDVIPIFEESLRKADYVAFDAEFSGKSNFQTAFVPQIQILEIKNIWLLW